SRGRPASGSTASVTLRPATTVPGASGWDLARPAQERLRALEQIGATAAKVFDPDGLARTTLDEAIRILTAERAFLFLADEDGALVPHLGRDCAGGDLTELTGYSASLVRKVHQSGELLVVTGTEQGAALGAHSVVLHGLRSIMVAPLQLDGRQLGVIYLDSHVAKGIFTPEDATILTALTHHIATSWETARAARLEISVQSAQRQQELAEALRAALEGMTATPDPQDVLARLVASAVSMLGCTGGWVLTAEQAQPLPITGPAVPGTDGLVPVALSVELSSAASWIAVPLCTADTSIGVLVLAADDTGEQLAAQIDVAAALASQGVTAYERATLFAQVQRLAVQDELTGLANRRHFFTVAERELASAVRHGRPVCALMIDIDHFKRVNDTYGHPTGDDVIRVVAQRLQLEVRALDVVGRYGGEEFAVVLPDTQSGADMAKRLLAGVADTPVPTRSGPLGVTISIGHARSTAGLGGLADLLARADRALYVAKREGRNQAVGD
ncbi:MAG: diguanylate cyclase, partial [Actinomycetota bacterium]|nr:diguanylate cyclase [Actinomycetota bacterium]